MLSAFRVDGKVEKNSFFLQSGNYPISSSDSIGDCIGFNGFVVCQVTTLQKIH
jgi:hypothetical protein